MDTSKVWRDFLALLQQSVIVQAILTLACGGVVLYMYATGQAVPKELLDLLNLLLGIWVGGKIAMAQSRLSVRR